MITIDKLKLEYNGVLLFSDFSLHVNRGTFTCLAGKSGTGKTSLLNAIMGFTPIKGGKIFVDNTQLLPSTLTTIRKMIGWMPQEVKMPMEYVKDMVDAPFLLKVNRNIYPKREERDCKLMEMFDLLGLSADLYQKHISEISGGERQRIMLATTALLKKEVILTDEPTSALDAESTERVLSLFYKLQNEGTTILAVSHSEALMEHCNDLIKIC